jgi:hypothetical protein
MTDFIDGRNKDRQAVIDEVLKITDGAPTIRLTPPATRR